MVDDRSLPVEISVTTRNCQVPNRLREEAVDRVEHATRFFDRLSGVEMMFRTEANPRIPEPAIVELTTTIKRHHIRAQGCGSDHREAVDVAISRFERQLSRYKARMLGRRRQPRASFATENGQMQGPVRTPDVVEEPAPIERTKQFVLSPMLPDDAVLQLELLDHQFYVFTNAGTGHCNVVYRRKDGSYGLIEAVPEQPTSVSEKP